MEDKKVKEAVEKLKQIQSKISDEKAKKAFDEKIKGISKPFNK